MSAQRTEDLLEAAWGIIANAGGGDWTKESPEWQEAAAKWRDAWHKRLTVAGWGAPDMHPVVRDLRAENSRLNAELMRERAKGRP